MATPTPEMLAAAEASILDGIEWPGRCPRCDDLFLNLPLHVRQVALGFDTCGWPDLWENRDGQLVQTRTGTFG